MVRDLMRGAIAGIAATWVMDQVTTSMLAAQTPAVTAREEQARPHGRSSAENVVRRFEEATGFELGDDLRVLATKGVHYSLGAVLGAPYVALGRHLGFVKVGGGLFYGLAHFLLYDEWLNTRLGFAGPPSAYPVQSHVRGLVGHLVLGVATDTIAGVLPL